MSGELPVSNAAHHQLVTAAAGGDDAALEAIFRLYHRRVYRFGLRACRDPFDADDAVQAVQGAVAELERPYRKVLVLRDIEGLSGEATCAALGLETAAMKTRLHRARSLLREKLVRALAGGVR